MTLLIGLQLGKRRQVKARALQITIFNSQSGGKFARGRIKRIDARGFLNGRARAR